MLKTTLYIRESLGLNSVAVRLHSIEVNNDEPRGGYYNQVRTSEGMLNRVAERWYSHWRVKSDFTTKTKFSRWGELDLQFAIERRQTFSGQVSLSELDDIAPKVKVLNHKSVWAFFDFIGFDYKNKKMSNLDSLIFIEKRQ